MQFSNDFEKFIKQIINDPEVHMINRNRGSGTRVLLDRYLSDQQPSGFFQEAKSHNSVAAAVAQKRADWGFAIRSVAEESGLGFIPIQDEEYDFVKPKERLQRPEINSFLKLFKWDHSKWSLFLFNFYEIQPALRIIARDKNITKKVQVILFREASALLALLNIELPLAAIPPIPSPLGL